MAENIKRTGPFPTRVIVRGDPDAPPIHDRTGNHDDSFFREWLTNTIWWAVRNNKMVSIYSEDL